MVARGLRKSMIAVVSMLMALALLMPAGAAQAATAAPRVVVAVIDSGINPYHVYFNAGGDPYKAGPPSSVTSSVLTALKIDAAHRLRLTRTGNFAADYAKDKARVWDKIKRGELYWFVGTNIIATTFAPGTRPILPDDSGDTHGVGTAGAVLRANPAAIVLFVEGITDASETFAFNHPAVDIITTSYGPIGSIPLPEHINNSYVGVVKKGKLHFGAADNSPSPAIQDGTAGPWWSIGVAGFEENSAEGKQILSGSLADFAADFTQNLPYCADCEKGYQSVSGTSFATPRSAGTMSKILLETRRALGHSGGIRMINGVPVMAAGNGKRITNWQLRRALEEAAYYPSTMDYIEAGGDPLETSAPVLDPAPWAQVGWGVITPASEHKVIPQTLAQLGISGKATRSKDSTVCTYMTAQIEARHLYWDQLVIGSESLGTTADPYIYCGQ
jgi:subtilisin family serine protease